MRRERVSFYHEILRPFKFMNKEYEMPDEYQQRLDQITEMRQERDKVVRQLPSMPPATRKQIQPMVARLNAIIKSTEQELAVDYETYQNQRRLSDELRQLDEELRRTGDNDLPLEGEALAHFKGAEAAAERLFILFKHAKPHLLEEFKAKVFADATPEYIEEFYEEIALREAFELDELLKRR
jgi:hypothetical protein